MGGRGGGRGEEEKKRRWCDGGDQESSVCLDMDNTDMVVLVFGVFGGWGADFTSYL